MKNKMFVAAMAMPVLGFTALSMAAGVTLASPPSNTCISPYVWRNARPGDAVCVTDQTRTKVAQENANPGANKQPGGGASGPETCVSGYVWRQAFDGDTICVQPPERDATLADNAAAASRVAGCTNWVHHGNTMTIVQSDGYTVPITGWEGSSNDGANATVIQPNGRSAYIDAKGFPIYTPDNNIIPDNDSGGSMEEGTVGGSIHGNNILINIRWLGLNPKVASSNTYGGTIDDNGNASGGGLNTQNNVHFNWHINEPFVCGP
jgi:hypothetical protein